MRIRQAPAEVLASLAELQVAAGQVFRDVGMPEVAQNNVDMADLEARQAAGQVWIGEYDGRIAGFVTASVVDGYAHIEQVSCVPDLAGQGIGRRLMEHVEVIGRHRGTSATTLTTFRDVPWNAPYYRRLGYRELSLHEVGPELQDILSAEAAYPGIDATKRCAMIKPNRRGPDLPRIRR
ncbi:GNAT family N-acetyltransferase [Micromonospora sp. MA102]|uniref:GNAT family N-acetyltransferase n=1 Tax=Micromonospora sp. MA102 TaxID=2952755 RepID=UPI0021C731BA|nr:GNAT family N-acetyltransferase [Micromonospora sp. MA102]